MSGTIITYLKDHLAGSVAALELLEHLVTLYDGADHGRLAQLRTEIQQDQHVLQQLLTALGGKESQIRNAAAWLTEKVGQVKLRIDDSGTGDLQLLEALETLALGIQGKLSLWRALEAVADRIPPVAALDLPGLQARAAQQYDRVDHLRLQVARRALAL